MIGTNDPYFNWLCILIGVNGVGRHAGYKQLADMLHYGEIFQPKLPMDANRGTDGLQMRVDFISEHGPWGSATNRGPCSMLEFFVALARRMNFLMYQSSDHRYTEYYFWKIMDNLGLSKVTDDKWEFINGDFFVEDAVWRINERQIQADGSGGLFPLKHPMQDQRGVEIWYQMNAWLMENSSEKWDF